MRAFWDQWGVDHRCSRRSSRDVLASWLVLSLVFSVLTQGIWIWGSGERTWCGQCADTGGTAQTYWKQRGGIVSVNLAGILYCAINSCIFGTGTGLIWSLL